MTLTICCWSISGHLDLLKYKLTPGEHEDEFQKIHQAVERATVLTRRLQHYSSGEVSRPELLNPRQALVEASSFLQRMISGAFRIQVVENAEASLIRIDRMRLLQVLVNLCSTACESIASGGVLQFEVRSGVTIPRQPLTRPSTPREKHVCLSVLAIPHVPQPGFIRAKKTSECDSRSGVGLAIVRGILSEIGGTLRLEPPCEKRTQPHPLLLSADARNRECAESQFDDNIGRAGFWIATKLFPCFVRPCG